MKVYSRAFDQRTVDIIMGSERKSELHLYRKPET